MKADALEIELAGEAVRLDRDGALVHDGAVLVADVHLDKATTFQRAGMALPLGDEDRDLERLGMLAERHRATELVIIGDLVHRPPRRGGATDRRVLAWLAAQQPLEVSVVLGNHDRDAAERLAHWPVRWVEEEIERGPFLLRHAPTQASARRSGARYELAGHLHPVLTLRDGRRDALRCPVFWRRPRGLVLPAFGSFTGGHAVRPGHGDVAYACTPAGVRAVSGPS